MRACDELILYNSGSITRYYCITTSFYKVNIAFHETPSVTASITHPPTTVHHLAQFPLHKARNQGHTRSEAELYYIRAHGIPSRQGALIINNDVKSREPRRSRSCRRTNRVRRTQVASRWLEREGKPAPGMQISEWHNRSAKVGGIRRDCLREQGNPGARQLPRVSTSLARLLALLSSPLVSRLVPPESPLSPPPFPSSLFSAGSPTLSSRLDRVYSARTCACASPDSFSFYIDYIYIVIHKIAWP